MGGRGRGQPGLVPRGAVPVAGGGGWAGRPHHPGAAVVWLGPAPVAAWPAGRGRRRLGRGRGGRERACLRTGDVDGVVGVLGEAPGSSRLCDGQRPGLADGEWNGRECGYVAHPTALQGSGDALECGRLSPSVPPQTRLGQRLVCGVVAGTAPTIPQHVTTPGLNKSEGHFPSSTYLEVVGYDNLGR